MIMNNPSLLRPAALLDKDWLFALTDDIETPDERTPWRPVRIPHDWSVEYPVSEDAASCGSGGYVRTGIGWYKKTLDLCKDPGKRVILRFDGVMMNCIVLLNGCPAGGHVYGYTPFEIDLTDLAREGENDLLVRVDNSRQPASRWYSGSGITRSVHLEYRNETHIDRESLYVTTRRVSGNDFEVRVTLEIKNPKPDCDVSLIIENTEGETVSRREMMPDGQNGFTAVLPLPDTRIWDVESPYLYRLKAVLSVSGSAADEISTRFGARETAFDPEQGFLLNGRKLILKGVCVHHDGGCVGAAVPAPVWRRRLEKLKEMGANALRCSHNPPDPALLDLTDELGFVVLDEAFDEWQLVKPKAFGSNTHESRGYSEWFNENWEADLRAMLTRDRNHPSIVMWSIGNEVPEQVTEQGAVLARRLTELCHLLDPGRPVTQACDQILAEPQSATDTFLEALDIVGINYADRWRGRAETMFDDSKLAHPERLYFGSEDCAVGGARGDCRLHTEKSVWGPTAYYSRMLKPERLWKFIVTHPYVMGSFMWTGIDYLGECAWPSKGSYSGVIDSCGFEKDGYYFYQSVWRKDKYVLHVFPNRNLPYEDGTVIPVIVYTNCFTAELIAGGRSYGVKAYEFPTQGMAGSWGHFERELCPVTTSDLHLTWDIPCGESEIVVIGRNEQGAEIARCTLTRTGKPDHMAVSCRRDECENGSFLQLEISLLDSLNRFVPDGSTDINISVKGGTLLGMDNGNQEDHTSYTAAHRAAFAGRLYALIRCDENAETELTLTGSGLTPYQIKM